MKDLKALEILIHLVNQNDEWVDKFTNDSLKAYFQEAIAELEILKEPNSCLKCIYRNAFDPYCSHPHISSKHVPEYINDIGCNYYEPKEDE